MVKKRCVLGRLPPHLRESAQSALVNKAEQKITTKRWGSSNNILFCQWLTLVLDIKKPQIRWFQLFSLPLLSQQSRAFIGLLYRILEILIATDLLVYPSVHRIFPPAKNQKGNADCYNQEMKFKTLTCLLAKPVHKKTVRPMDHCNSSCHYADYSKRG